MGTRGRAVIVTVTTTLLVFIGLAGIIDYEQVVMNRGVSSQILAEFIVAGLISLILVVGTWWTLYFKRKGLSLMILGTLPGMTIFPFLLIFESIVSSIFSGFGQLAIAIISSVVIGVSTYLLLLTANILNGAILFDIPLGQAGKASQFIFSLISSYFLIALLFGAAFPIELRVLFIGAFVLYFSFSTTWSLQVPARQAWLTAFSISLLMVLATLLLSIWPIGSIYATLTMVVILYILLNIALEMRENITGVIWVEYTLLLSLVVMILLTNGAWGISGTII